MRRLALLAAALMVGFGVAGTDAQRTLPIDVTLLLSRLADTVVAYYGRAQSIMCDEIVSEQHLSQNMSPDMSPMRKVQYELRLSWEPMADAQKPEASVLRTLVRVNNRPPREKDKEACMDPGAVSQDALSMFLPDNQREYVFTSAGTARVDGRQTLMVDFKPRTMGKPSVAWKNGKDDCISFDLNGHTRGRVWIDPSTAEVLRLEEHLAGLIDLTVPRHPKRFNEPERITIERLDAIIKFRRVAFSDPDETLLLPASQEAVTIVRSSMFSSNRVTQDFKNYRRFMTDIRIVQ